MRRSTSLTLLNTLSLTRLPLAALFLVSEGALTRVGLILGAAFTDFLDGYIARHHNLVSRLGALIDPVADRAFVVTAFVTYVLEGALSPWQFFIVLVRDVSTLIGYFIARAVPSLRGVEFKARLPGKLVTALQLAVLVAVPLLPVVAGAAAPDLLQALVLTIGALSLWAVVDYTVFLVGARAR
jgi:CDP-diacylglycerol--glycerol-3-phosphate 3-phosphatidyltransferase